MPSHLHLPSPTPRKLLTTTGASSGFISLSSTPINLRSSGMPPAVGPAFLHDFGTLPAIIPLLCLLSSCRLHQHFPFLSSVMLKSSESYPYRVSFRASSPFHLPLIRIGNLAPTPSQEVHGMHSTVLLSEWLRRPQQYEVCQC